MIDLLNANLPYRITDGAVIRPYQLRAAHAIFNSYGKDGTPVIIDMGLGKTVIVLTAIKDLLFWGILKKPVLIVAPILVCETVWRQEARLWSHTQNLKFSLLTGKQHRRSFNINRQAHIYLINPELLDWLIKECRGALPEHFDMVVNDDVRLAYNSKRFKYISNYGDQHYLRDDRGHAVIGEDGKPLKVPPNRYKVSCYLTGTPAPTSLLNLWAPMFFMDQGKRLHQHYDTFKDHFFYKQRQVADHVYKYEPLPGELEIRPEWMPKEGAPQRIHELMADVAIELNGADYGILPQSIGNATTGAVPPSHLHYVELPQEIRAAYDKLEKEALVELGKDLAMAANGGAKSNMCWQIANGFLYWRSETGAQRTENMHSQKLLKLGELIADLGTNTIIPYHFKADFDRITKYFAEQGIPFATLGKKNSQATIDAWNAGKIPNLLLHPQSAGHGLNIQFGGHTVIWYTMLWSMDRYSQTVARLARSGQTGIVGIHHIVARKTVDELMLIALSERGDTQARFRAALSAYQKLIGLDRISGPLDGVGGVAGGGHRGGAATPLLGAPAAKSGLWGL